MEQGAEAAEDVGVAGLGEVLEGGLAEGGGLVPAGGGSRRRRRGETAGYTASGCSWIDLLEWLGSGRGSRLCRGRCETAFRVARHARAAPCFFFCLLSSRALGPACTSFRKACWRAC